MGFLFFFGLFSTLSSWSKVSKTIRKRFSDICFKSLSSFFTEVSPKLCIILSSNHAQQGVDERFFQGFGMIPANGIKIFTQCGFGNDVSQIREGETVAASDFMPTFGDVFQPCSIDPGNGSRHHRKIDVIDHGMGITGLTFAAANVLFDLLETGFDFPPCTIVLDYLFMDRSRLRDGLRDAPKIISFYSSISEYPFSDAICAPL